MFESIGVHQNRTYRRPFPSAVRASLVGNPGALPSPEKMKFLELAEMQFPAVLGAYLYKLATLFSLFLVDILSRSQFFSHHTLTISTQIWTSYETHIFKKSWVRTRQTPRGSTSVLHLINE